MIKVVFCLRRRAEFTAQEFQSHWFDVHAPLVRKHQEALRIARYVQLHTDHGPMTEKLRAFRGSPAPYDGIAEIWYASLARAGRASGTTRRHDAPAGSCGTTRSVSSICPAPRSGSPRKEKSSRRERQRRTHDECRRCGPGGQAPLPVTGKTLRPVFRQDPVLKLALGQLRRRRRLRLHGRTAVDELEIVV